MSDQDLMEGDSGEETVVNGSGDVIRVSGNIVNSTIIIKSVVRDDQTAGLEKLPPEPGDPPYQGLQYFSERDAGRFFGREGLTARVIGRLQRTRFLAVIGASGSGKSSLLRAGIVPALKSGNRLVDGSLPPTGSSNWLYRVFTPGAHPLDALSAALSQKESLPSRLSSLHDELSHDPRSLALAAQALLVQGGNSHLFLVVDQLEEIFTQARSSEERQTFIDALVTASGSDDQQPVSVIVCLRADFYAQVAQFDNLRDLISQHQEFIGAMSRAELVDAIVGPLNQGGWRIQEGLVKVILDDVGYEPGSLPLLSHALLETWKRRRGRTLTLSGYVDCGGVEGAIRETAEAVFRQRLTPSQQAIARLIFLHLAALSEDAQDTRRRASFSELITRSTDEPTIQAVVNILVDARLVTTSTIQPDDTKVVEIAHESLIREWPTLREWLSKDRQGLLLHQQLAEAAEDWGREGQDPGLLYRGKRLAQIQEWAGIPDNSGLISRQEDDFIQASELNAKQEQEKEARLKRLKRTQLIFTTVTASLLVLVGVLGYITLRPKAPPLMDGLYNIAIAQIGEVGADGQVHALANDAGGRLSQTIATALQDSLQANPSMLIWNDSAALKKRGVQIGVVDAAGSAVSLAGRLNADMIIYGVVDQRSGTPMLNMQMYLAPRLADVLDEVNGSFDLHTPIPVASGIETDAVKLELTRQTNLLATLALGQSESQLGHTLEALEFYLKAEQLAPGSDLIQFFLAREYLFSLEREPVLQVVTDAFEQKALEALEKALQVNPQNARAHIALGSLYLKQAKRLYKQAIDSEFTDQDFKEIMALVDQAEASYSRVLQLDIDPGQYGVPVKDIANLGLGDTTLLRGIALQAYGQPDPASEAFGRSVQLLTATLPAFQGQGLSRYLAQNHQFLGSAYQNTGYIADLAGDSSAALKSYQKAIEQFDDCIDLGSTSNDRVIQSEIVAANCQPLRQDTEDSIQKLGGGP